MGCIRDEYFLRDSITVQRNICLRAMAILFIASSTLKASGTCAAMFHRIRFTKPPMRLPGCWKSWKLQMTSNFQIRRRCINSRFQFITTELRTDQVAMMIHSDVESQRKLALDSMLMLRAGKLRRLELKHKAFYMANATCYLIARCYIATYAAMCI